MSKFDKFTMVDPVGGEGGGGEERSVQEMVANEVNDRMDRAVEDLKDKYDNGGRGYEAASDAQPTGVAYARAKQEEARRRKAAKAQRQAAEANIAAEDAELAAQLKISARLDGEIDSEEDDEANEDSRAIRKAGHGSDGEADSDDELLDGLDEDPEIKRIRESRLSEMKRLHEARAEHIARGHGQYREIVQDEFLPEVTSSEKVVVHFFHNEFQRCKVMDARLAELASRHLETKMLKINAEKAPFFVHKLQVKILPTVVCFIDGIAVHSIIGFDGLAEALPEDKLDQWPVSNLARELALAKVIVYSRRDVPNDARSRHQENNRSIRVGVHNGSRDDED